jgi:hypothetical protein
LLIKDSKAFGAYRLKIGMINEKSLLNVSDMLDNYTGIYKGIFLAAYNNKILTELELRPDYSHNLKQKYLIDNIIEEFLNHPENGIHRWI